MRRWAGAAIVCFVLLVAASPGGAQPSLEVHSVDPVEGGELQVTVAVPPAMASDGLSADAFLVELGGHPVPLSAIEQMPAPVDVILVVDSSGSMEGSSMAALKAAAGEFINRLAPTIRVGVVEFDSTARVAAPVAEDRSSALAAVDALDAGGDTALWDALVAAAGLVEDRPAYVVALSDGEDNASTADRATATASLASAGAPLYALSLMTDVADRDALAAVVGEVGGELFAAEDPVALPALYEQVGARLSNLWLLRFRPTHTTPQPLVVGLAGHGGTTAAVDVPPTTSTVEPTEAVLRTPVVADWARHGLWLGPLSLLGAALAVWLLVSRRDAPLLHLSTPVGGEGLRGRLVDVADRAIPSARRSPLDQALEAADANIRPGELVAAVVIGAASFAAVGVMLIGWWGVVAAAAAPLAARVELSRRAGRRRSRFAEQLPDTLAMLSSSLRVGKAVPQALELVSSEAPEPTASEFRRVVIEARIGRDLVDALSRVSDRTGSGDFQWVSRAVGINQELGGDLAEVLDNVAVTIRERAQIARQVRSLSAEGRLSAWVLMALPLGVAALVAKMNPGYLSPLHTETIGQILSGLCLVMFAVAGLWIRRVINLKY